MGENLIDYADIVNYIIGVLYAVGSKLVLFKRGWGKTFLGLHFAKPISYAFISFKNK